MIVGGLADLDIMSDATSGFVILLDQPFRVGDVVDIGTRTTHIRTGDNRLVIVPNSTIGASQVINYSYPDPEYRVQIEIGVAYGSDFDQVRSVIFDTVRAIDGVLPDKPVDALYHEFGDSSRTMRVRWWIDTYRDEKPMLDQVNTALEFSLDRAGIEMPFNTYNLNLKTEDLGAAHIEQSND